MDSIRNSDESVNNKNSLSKQGQMDDNSPLLWQVRREEVALDDTAPVVASKTETTTKAVTPYEDNWEEAFNVLVDQDAPPAAGGKTKKQAATGARKQ